MPGHGLLGKKNEKHRTSDLHKAFRRHAYIHRCSCIFACMHTHTEMVVETGRNRLGQQPYNLLFYSLDEGKSSQQKALFSLEQCNQHKYLFG